MDQNDDLFAKMPKIVVCRASSIGIIENQKFFFAQTLVWTYNSSFKNVPRWFRKKRPSTKLLHWEGGERLGERGGRNGIEMERRSCGREGLEMWEVGEREKCEERDGVMRREGSCVVEGGEREGVGGRGKRWRER